MARLVDHGSSTCVDGGGCSTAKAARLTSPSLARNGGASPLCPAAGKVTTAEWFTFDVITDADLSALGEARHRTIGGRGVVGQLIAKARK